MSFHENARFPESISYGSRGGPGYSTGIIKGEGNAEHRVARWSAAARSFNIKWGIKSLADMRAVYKFYLVRMGSSYGFRYKDWNDYSTYSDFESAPQPTDSLLGTGDGSNTVFQLTKIYQDNGYEIVRNLTKPYNSSVRVAVNEAEVVSGWTCDYTTGRITFSSAPTAGHTVKAGCYFDVPARFGPEADKLLVCSLDDFDQASIPDIPLDEIMDATPVPRTTTEPGGSVEICPTVAATLALTARLWSVCTQYVTDLFLPDPDLVPLGGPLWYVTNLGPTLALNLKLDDLTTTLVSIPVGKTAQVLLTADGDGNRIYYAL